MKKLLYLKKIDKIFLKLIAYVVGLIVLTTLITASILYYNFENIEINRIRSSSLDAMSQISFSATFITDWVKTIGSQIRNEADITALHYQNSSENRQEILSSLNKLLLYKASMLYIHSIYLYDRNSDIFFTTFSGYEISERKNFYDQDIFNILDDFSPYTRYVPITRKVKEPLSSESNPMYSNVHTYVYYNGPESEKKLQRAIVINISEQWLKKTVAAMDTDKTSDILVVDSRGKTVCTTRKYDMLSDLSDEEFIQKIFSSSAPSGSDIVEVDGIKSLVVYSSSAKLDWKYIKVIPYDHVLQKIIQMRNTTFLVALLILIFSILVSFLASFRVYRPIKSVIRNVKALNAEKFRSRNPLKQELLKSIMTGAVLYRSEELQQRFNELDMNFNIREEYMLVYFIIDKYSDFCKKYNSCDRNLMRFAILNIASELAEAQFANESVDMGDDNVILIINGPGLEDEVAQQGLEKLVRNIQEMVAKHLNISMTAVLSPIAHLAGDFQLIYEECRNASRYRLFSGHMGLIHSEKVNVSQQDEYVYPADKEKLLTDALIQGKIEDAKEIYMRVIDETQKFSYTAFMMTLLHMSLAIGMALNSIEKNRGIHISYNIYYFYQQLTTNEVLEDIHRQFFELLDQISLRIKVIKSSQMNKLADKVYKIIQENYEKNTLSLESIADDLGMSSIYLGRQFKKIVTKSVSDCINEYRIQKAVQLMDSTNLTINEIIDSVGFPNKNYFYPLFKKMYGVTPNEFRNRKSQAEPS